MKSLERTEISRRDIGRIFFPLLAALAIVPGLVLSTFNRNPPRGRSRSKRPGRNQRRFKGVGIQVTRLFVLKEGLAIFRLKHTGQGTFIVQLLDESGTLVKELVNTSGNYRGQIPCSIATTQRYLLSVAADCMWSVSVLMKPGAVEEPNPPETPETTKES